MRKQKSWVSALPDEASTEDTAEVKLKGAVFLQNKSFYLPAPKCMLAMDTWL